MRIKYGRLWVVALIFLVVSLCTALAAHDPTADQAASKSPASNDVQWSKTCESNVYKEIELVGTSPISWEEAVQAIVASEYVKDIQTIEVKELDVRVDNHNIVEYLAKVTLLAAFERRDHESNQGLDTQKQKPITLSGRPESKAPLQTMYNGQKHVKATASERRDSASNQKPDTQKQKPMTRSGRPESSS